MSELTFYGDLCLPQPITVALDLPEHYIVNLEAPFTGAEPGYPGKINLRSSLAAFDATFNRLPLAVCLANNHIMDFFEQGFLETVRALDERGILYFGAGYLRDNCNNPLIVDVASERVGLMGYVCPTTSPVFAEKDQPGCIPISVEKIREDVEVAKENGAEHIIIHLHWGAEQVGLPKPEDVLLARAIAGLDVDLIIGHHAHCIQLFENVEKASVFYGLGNWIFPAQQTQSFYSEDGTSSRAYPVQLYEKNKRSLAVSYALASKEVTVEPNYFSGERLIKGRFKVERYRATLDTGKYNARFARAFKWGKFKHIMDGYFAAPKLPRPEHFVNLFKLARARKYD